MATYQGYSGNVYQLAAKPFAAGGEGEVYEVENYAGLVAKIYHQQLRTTSRERKIKAMGSTPPPKAALSQLAWPLDCLYDNGKFAGFIMPKIDETQPLNAIYPYDKRQSLPWLLFVTVAKNLSSAVHNVHEIGHVCGDINPLNIRVNPKTGLVTLIDTDSFHVRSPEGTTYRCEVGVPEFLPRELHGRDLKFDPLPTFSQETDLFTLAVLIFQLLMNGAHPFACAVKNVSASKFQPLDNILNGTTPFFNSSRNVNIPVYAPPLSALPVKIQQLFKCAFVDGHRNPYSRPSALEWHSALTELVQQTKTCAANPNHQYYNGLKSCPWCAVDKAVSSLMAQQPYLGGNVKPAQPAPKAGLSPTTARRVRYASYSFWSTGLALWLVTLPLSILGAYLIYTHLSPIFFVFTRGSGLMDIIFEFFCAIGPYVVFTAGLIGTMVYNSSWSNSAKKRPNNFGNYILSLLTFAAFTIGGGLLVMFATIAIPLAVVICICASLASGGK